MTANNKTMTIPFHGNMETSLGNKPLVIQVWQGMTDNRNRLIGFISAKTVKPRRDKTKHKTSYQYNADTIRALQLSLLSELNKTAKWFIKYKKYKRYGRIIYRTTPVQMSMIKHSTGWQS